MFALAKKAMPEATPTSVFSELSNNQKSIPELDLSAGPGGATCANCGDAGTCFECNTASRNPSCHSLAQCLATAQLPMEAFRRQTADLTSAIVNKGKPLRGVPESAGLSGRRPSWRSRSWIASC
jgi:hypothetical protein